MRPQNILVAIFVLNVLLCSGCGNSLLSLYPEFLQQKEASRKAAIICDFTVLESTQSETTKIDLINNKQLAVQFLDFMSDRLNEKGYHIETRTLSSVGLLMDKGTLIKVITTADDLKREDWELPLASPPLYIYPAFNRDTTLRSILAGMYVKLINSKKEEDRPSPVVPEAVPLGKVMESDMIFVLLLGGHRVPVSQEYGNVSTIGVDKHGKVAGHQTSQLSLMLYIVDTETGAVIWSDRWVKLGGTIYTENIHQSARRLLENLP